MSKKDLSVKLIQLKSGLVRDMYKCWGCCTVIMNEGPGRCDLCLVCLCWKHADRRCRDHREQDDPHERSGRTAHPDNRKKRNPPLCYYGFIEWRRGSKVKLKSVLLLITENLFFTVYGNFDRSLLTFATKRVRPPLSSGIPPSHPKKNLFYSKKLL